MGSLHRRRRALDGRDWPDHGAAASTADRLPLAIHAGGGAVFVAGMGGAVWRCVPGVEDDCSKGLD